MAILPGCSLCLEARAERGEERGGEGAAGLIMITVSMTGSVV